LEDDFWKFVDQKWRDSLNVAAGEPSTTDYSVDGGRTQKRGDYIRISSKRGLWHGSTQPPCTSRRRRPNSAEDKGEGLGSASFQRSPGALACIPHGYAKLSETRLWRKEAKSSRATSCARSACSTALRLYVTQRHLKLNQSAQYQSERSCTSSDCIT
jgi:hypothetical protein